MYRTIMIGLIGMILSSMIILMLWVTFIMQNTTSLAEIIDQDRVIEFVRTSDRGKIEKKIDTKKVNLPSGQGAIYEYLRWQDKNENGATEEHSTFAVIEERNEEKIMHVEGEKIPQRKGNTLQEILHDAESDHPSTLIYEKNIASIRNERGMLEHVLVWDGEDSSARMITEQELINGEKIKNIFLFQSPWLQQYEQYGIKAPIIADAETNLTLSVPEIYSYYLMHPSLPPMLAQGMFLIFQEALEVRGIPISFLNIKNMPISISQKQIDEQKITLIGIRKNDDVSKAFTNTPLMQQYGTIRLTDLGKGGIFTDIVEEKKKIEYEGWSIQKKGMTNIAENNEWILISDASDEVLPSLLQNIEWKTQKGIIEVQGTWEDIRSMLSPFVPLYTEIVSSLLEKAPKEVHRSMTIQPWKNGKRIIMKEYIENKKTHEEEEKE